MAETDKMGAENKPQIGEEYLKMAQERYWRMDVIDFFPSTFLDITECLRVSLGDTSKMDGCLR